MSTTNKRPTKTQAKSLARKKFSKKSVILFVALVVIVGVVTLYRLLAATAQGAYTNWNWPATTNGYTSMAHSLKIESNDPTTSYFWSHQYKIKNGDGGYIGLQSNGRRVDGTRGKTAVFSIFSSGIAGTKGACSVEQAGFDGYDTSGTSCRIAYEWKTGVVYQLRVAQTSTDSTGKWWSAWVKDTSNGTETFIAQIKVPMAWMGLDSWSVMWTEYFGPEKSTCAGIPYSRVRFYTPSVGAFGSVKPTSKSNYLSTTSDCKTSKIVTTSDGVIQEMGSSVPTSTTQTVAAPDPGFIGLNSDFVACPRITTKTDGTKVCNLTVAEPLLTMRKLPVTPAGKTKFCFKGIKSAAGTAKIDIVAGQETTGSTLRMVKTITADTSFDDACVGTSTLFKKGSLTNYAQVRVTQGAVKIYGGQFK